MVLIEFPCTYWSQLTQINFTTNSSKQKLKKLRESHRPFINLTRQIVDNQVANDDFYLVENPLRSQARNERPLRELEARDDSYVAISDMCRFGLRHPQSGRPIKKPTWWLTNAPEIAWELNMTCKHIFLPAVPK